MKNELIHMGNMRGGKWEKTFEESRRFYSADGISPTVTAKGGGNQEIKIGEVKSIKEKSNATTVIRVRRLTALECYRLMGFDDEDYDKARAVVSEGQLYKQAGNSIVVNVLEAIFTNLRPYFREETT